MILIELAFAGLFIVLAFFTKLSSVPPALKATIIGVRIILGLSVVGIGIHLGIKYYNEIEEKRLAEQEARELREKIKVFSPIGSWGINDDGKIDFYTDSTFHETFSGMLQDGYGSWRFYIEDETGVIQLNYNSKTRLLKITKIDVNKLEVYEGGKGTIEMIKR